MNARNFQECASSFSWSCRGFLIALFIFIIYANVSFVASQEHPEMVLLSEVVFSGKVVAVNSGDTLEVDSNGEIRKVHLESIDAPEKGQSYGEAAREFLSKLVLGESVIVHARIYDWSGKKISLGRVVKDDEDLSTKMIEAGLAWYCDRPFSRGSLQDLAFDAKSAKKGLWQESNPLPPWQFRGERECFRENEP